MLLWHCSLSPRRRPSPPSMPPTSRFLHFPQRSQSGSFVTRQIPLPFYSKISKASYFLRVKAEFLQWSRRLECSLLKVWSEDLLNQGLHFNKVLRGCVCTLGFKQLTLHALTCSHLSHLISLSSPFAHSSVASRSSCRHSTCQSCSIPRLLLFHTLSYFLPSGTCFNVNSLKRLP